MLVLFLSGVPIFSMHKTDQSCLAWLDIMFQACIRFIPPKFDLIYLETLDEYWYVLCVALSFDTSGCKSMFWSQKAVVVLLSLRIRKVLMQSPICWWLIIMVTEMQMLLFTFFFLFVWNTQLHWNLCAEDLFGSEIISSKLLLHAFYTMPLSIVHHQSFPFTKFSW